MVLWLLQTTSLTPIAWWSCSHILANKFSNTLRQSSIIQNLSSTPCILPSSLQYFHPHLTDLSIKDHLSFQHCIETFCSIVLDLVLKMIQGSTKVYDNLGMEKVLFMSVRASFNQEDLGPCTWSYWSHTLSNNKLAILAKYWILCLSFQSTQNLWSAEHWYKPTSISHSKRMP